MKGHSVVRGSSREEYEDRSRAIIINNRTNDLLLWSNICVCV